MIRRSTPGAVELAGDGGTLGAPGPLADAGLTHGAFYAHFDSKEDLVVNTVADQLRGQRETYGAQSLEEIVRGYLSVQHRDDTEGGCPSAALLDEIARSSDAVKRAYTDGQLVIIDDVAARLAPADPGSARVQALGAFALMVGTPWRKATDETSTVASSASEAAAARPLLRSGASQGLIKIDSTEDERDVFGVRQ